jgi:hypothetical protein
MDICYTDEGGKVYCYKKLGSKGTWEAGAASCADLGGRLPVVLLAGKTDFLVKYVQPDFFFFCVAFAIC